MKPEKKKKIERELEQIKRMQSISDIIDRSSSENTLLYTSSRENESLGDNAIDKMLNKMASRENEHEIRVVEDLSKGPARSEPHRTARTASRPKQRHHAVAKRHRAGASHKHSTHLVHRAKAKAHVRASSAKKRR